MKTNHICDECKKNNASIFYKQTINGKTTEMHLCEECAEKAGLTSGIESSFTSPFDDIFSHMLFGVPDISPKLLSMPEPCPVCGFTLRDIKKTSRFGCSECYKVFENYIDKRSIGDGEYKGKTPKSLGKKIKEIVTDAAKDIKEAISDQKEEKAQAKEIKKDINALRAQLKKAVASEDYEQAAKLRDEIKALEASENK